MRVIRTQSPCKISISKAESTIPGSEEYKGWNEGEEDELHAMRTGKTLKRDTGAHRKDDICAKTTDEKYSHGNCPKNKVEHQALVISYCSSAARVSRRDGMHRIVEKTKRQPRMKVFEYVWERWCGTTYQKPPKEVKTTKGKVLPRI